MNKVKRDALTAALTQPPTGREAPEPSVAASTVFGSRLPLARDYAQLLAGDGIVRGLIGPHEAARLWDRHLVNSALLTTLLPLGARVVDVGSGAGLPGLPMAIRRPDLAVTLVEPLLRRCEFLTSAVESLGLGSSVRVVRGRAQSRAVRETVMATDWVVARAVARLDRLVELCLPLLTPGGSLLALKGMSASAEAAKCLSGLRHLGVESVDVRELKADSLAEPTWVVTVRRGAGGSIRRREPRRGR